MKKVLFIFLLLAVSLLTNSFKDEPVALVGNKISTFQLKGTDNTIFNLANAKEEKGYIVVFTCNHCPFAKLYTERLNALNTKYKALGVPLIAINSMDTVAYDQESFSLMQQRATSEHFNFPYLQDQQQTVARNFKANRTPHAFVIWKENGEWVIRYDGAIDDNGQEPKKATPFVANAVDELLKGKAVKNAETSSIGCTIYFRK